MRIGSRGRRYVEVAIFQPLQPKRGALNTFFAFFFLKDEVFNKDASSLSVIGRWRLSAPLSVFRKIVYKLPLAETVFFAGTRSARGRTCSNTVTPVLPNPLVPCFVGSKSCTSSIGGVACASKMNWAMRCPASSFWYFLSNWKHRPTTLLYNLHQKPSLFLLTSLSHTCGPSLSSSAFVPQLSHVTQGHETQRTQKCKYWTHNKLTPRTWHRGHIMYYILKKYNKLVKYTK